MPTIDVISKATPQDRLDTKRDLAAFLQLTPRTIDRLMANGLPHYKIGNQRARFIRTEVVQWLHATCRTVRVRTIRRPSSAKA